LQGIGVGKLKLKKGLEYSRPFFAIYISKLFIDLFSTSIS
jgi:hypothetical protein